MSKSPKISRITSLISRKQAIELVFRRDEQMRRISAFQTHRTYIKDPRTSNRIFTRLIFLQSYSTQPQSCRLKRFDKTSRVGVHNQLSNYLRRPQSTMAKAKVLLLGEVEHAHDALKSLGDMAEIIEPKSDNRKDFIQECKDGKLDGVLAAYRTFFSASITGLWDEELVSALPRSLQFVAHNGAGYDQLDPQALSSRDPPIIATHVPTAVDDATADTAVFLLIGALRNFNTSILALRRGDWRGNPPPALGNDPQGKLLGILGMGGIGRNLAAKCRALGMHVQYHNRNKLGSAELEGGAKYVGFEELLQTSDVISVHVPLNKNTTHLLGEKELGMCKDGVVIVNTARGAVIDEAALVKKIDEGKVASVGLDVFEEEPKVHEGLVNNDRVLLLPHMGTWTYETQKMMEEWNIGNLKAAVDWYFNGKKDGAEKMSIIAEQKDMWQKILEKGSS